jgi:hypothetical protein
MRRTGSIGLLTALIVVSSASAADADTRRGRLPFHLKYMFSFTAILVQPPEVIGPVPEGLRANFYIAPGGVITGPKLNGMVRPVGGDWLLMRRDGVALLDVRTTFESDDGAVIGVAYTGTLDAGPDGYRRFAQGQLPAVLPLRTSIRFETADPRYAWLNRLLGIGVGELDVPGLRVRYDVYAVRRPERVN